MPGERKKRCEKDAKKWLFFSVVCGGMKVLRKIGQYVVELALTVAIFAVLVMFMRDVNEHRFPAMASGGASPADKSAYGTGEGVRAIEGEYLNGFHFTPEVKRHEGVVVVFGGSEGSPNFDTAQMLYDDGHEVLSLFFFGQPNQAPALSRVPLEQFDEVRAFIDEHVSGGPVTVLGASKGAELALLLAAHGFDVDNVVAYAPAHYSYSGLDFSSWQDTPSFTLRGEDVPYASIRDASWLTGMRVGWQTLTKYPVSYRATYEQAAEAADDAARIDLSGFSGNVLLFAGQDDRMWQSEVAADTLASISNRFEAHVFPDAGHAFIPDGEERGAGWERQLGGTAEGNRAALRESNELLLQRLREWH